MRLLEVRTDCWMQLRKQDRQYHQRQAWREEAAAAQADQDQAAGAFRCIDTSIWRAPYALIVSTWAQCTCWATAQRYLGSGRFVADS